MIHFSFISAKPRIALVGMARFQLEIAFALAVLIAASLFLLVLNRQKDGKIQLPGNVTEAEQSPPDPFDVTTHEDFLEGYPVDEENFWKKAPAHPKMPLGYLISRCSGSAVSTAQPVSYLVILSVRSVRQDNVELNSQSIVHLTVLLSVASVTLGVSAILPNSPPLTSFEYFEPISKSTKLWYSTVSLYIVACFIAFTTPRGPPLYFPYESIYSQKTVSGRTNTEKENVTGVYGASCWGYLYFSYSTKVVMLGNTSESLEIADLPIVPANMRATVNYFEMKKALKKFKLKIGSWRPKIGSGWNIGYTLFRFNLWIIIIQFWIAVASAILFYAPAMFSRMLIAYLEMDPERKDRGWGWVYVVGMFLSNIIGFFTSAQLWSLSTTTLQTRFRIQLNSILFAKTLIRKDSVSSAPPKKDKDQDPKASENEDDFTSKAQIMTLMTTDTDRLSEFAWHFFALVDSPIELIVGTIFLYKLLGISCFFGLAVTCLFLPLNHFAGKVVVGAQDNLMKARDERIALMNEILGGIRMLKFMAWERSFEARVMKIREKELKYQKLNYIIEICFNAIWNASPILVTLVSFWHFTVVRGEALTPSIAFTSIMVFSELKFALNALPETFINMLQSLVSMRRIEKYLNTAEITSVLPLSEQPQQISFQSCTVTWPQDRNSGDSSIPPSVASTPRQKFILIDLTLKFPTGELSLVCGKLGSGKTLLLLALLGEADILAGQLICPRSPPNIMTSFTTVGSGESWIIQGVCAYVPQSAWLRNASIKDNILFNLPYDEERYRKTLEVCALVTDLEILEDGDESEIGERGVNLSGGQKARVSLARAVYSRASILFLDDVLSAVDAHTAHHLYHECLKGELLKGRTVILVSHHVQLCVPGANYIVAFDNGRVQFEGTREAFQSSGVIRTLMQSTIDETGDGKEEQVIEEIPVSTPQSSNSDPDSETATIAPTPATAKGDKKPARKLVEEESRAVGRVSTAVWLTYIRACGSYWYWIPFGIAYVIAALSPVAENGWLKVWSGSVLDGDNQKSPTYYIAVYALVTFSGLIITTTRWIVLYAGSIHASTVLHKRQPCSSPINICPLAILTGLLETVLFANMRFHDTISRGRLLNRFGKDFEGIDSSLSDNFGRSIQYALSAVATLISVSVAGGPPFVVAALILGVVYWNVAKIYGQTSRDMRRLDSVTRSPLYSINGETIAGATIIRAFGASSKFLRDMLRCLDTNANPYYWMWGVNRWLSIRFNVLSSCILGAIACIAVFNPAISASLAGFSIAFAYTVTSDLLFMVRRFVGLEQSMVALERVKEFSELKREAAEFIEPRPPASWPATGAIKCEDLVIRYAPELPNVLHKLNFDIRPGEKIGILGRTGSGKSTLALSFFRFVEATEGRILVDDIDIANVGLTDLRSKLTIIPQDPTILSGTLRSTLDVFDEYEDLEIFEALRRVHLIPPSDTLAEDATTVNANIFRNLDSSVSEGGENFSTGEKQLLCMARAILKRSKVLVMDEATASVDYATDELIGKTIRQEFADSTILTIAHRLRTVIDYDRIMLLDQGRIVEFDKPQVLLANSSSKFHTLCKATGKDEFSTLRKLAGL
ncbi:multidrug resistance-associated ABC transporter [Lentinula aciculospora]|uniref:Multidrug resistance-associated ABC transporter n=1 Tax=Lentinula aciculospora TaxID=153920 RepID=A0A9W9ATI7_9AGAR|nr:multidrug resistance-associated ABC transporter [Lentinula aciculospora]